MADKSDIRNYPPSEYGGTHGLEQPEPHVLTPDEVISVMRRNDDPADPESGKDVQDRFGPAG